MIPGIMADGNIEAAVGTPSLAVFAKRFCDVDVGAVDVPFIPIQRKSDVLTAFSMPAYSSVEHLQPICIILSNFPEVCKGRGIKNKWFHPSAFSISRDMYYSDFTQTIPFSRTILASSHMDISDISAAFKNVTFPSSKSLSARFCFQCCNPSASSFRDALPS